MKKPNTIIWPSGKMRFRKLFTIVMISLVVLSVSGCENDTPVEAVASEGKSDSGPFVLPDSIDTALLIAMFDENDPPGHCILVYTDNNKSAARKIKYLADKSVLIESLALTNYRELRCNASNSVYLIKDKSVTRIQGGPPRATGGVTLNNIAIVTEHKRTDTHLREYDIVIKQ